MKRFLRTRDLQQGTDGLDIAKFFLHRQRAAVMKQQARVDGRLFHRGKKGHHGRRLLLRSGHDKSPHPNATKLFVNWSVAGRADRMAKKREVNSLSVDIPKTISAGRRAQRA